MPIPRRTALAIGAVVLVAALAANATVALHSIRVLDQGYDNVERPSEVQRTLLGLRSVVQDAETGQRGYLLTGDRDYLRPYERARGEADSLLARLTDLVSWNPLQVGRLPALRSEVDEKFEDLDETIRLYDQASPAAALAVVQTGRGKAAMSRVRARLDQMGSEAARVRAAYTERSARARRNARRAAWASTAGLAGLFLLLALGVRADARRRERFADGLARANAELADANQAQAEANAALSTALAEREAALARVRAMQAQLVQQEKLAGMGRLTAGVAHEIKNPLNFVTNFAGLTTDLAREATDALDRGDTAEVKTLLGTITQNAGKIKSHGQRADEIVQAMLTHARGVTGERRAVELAETIDVAVEQAVGPDGLGRVGLSVDVDPALGPAEVVPESVVRAVRNLVENALHAVRQRDGAGDPGYRPAVRVAAERGTDHDGHPAAVVTVSDNGAGIPDDLFPRVFEPFFTTKGPGAGTGLGLSLAHDIAVGHGGSLLATRPEGGGAAFVLTLPLVAPEGSAGAAELP